MFEEEAPEEEGDRFTVWDAWAILKMQKWVVIGSVVFCLLIAGIQTLLATRYYDARAVLHVTATAKKEVEMGELVVSGLGLFNRGEYLATQIAITKSRAVRMKILRAYEKLEINDGVKADPAGLSLLARSTTIKTRQGTELLDVIVSTPDPELSARLANITAQVMKEEALVAMTESANGARTWLEGRLKEYDHRIITASNAVLAYQRLHDMADVEDSVTSLGARMSSLKTAYGVANTERVQQETTVNSHESMLRKGRLRDLAKDMDSAVLSGIMSQLAEALADNARIRARYKEKHPKYLESEAEIQRIKEELRGEVQRSLSAERARLEILRNRELALENAINGGKDQLLDVQGLREDYEKKKIELESAKLFYSRMKERMGELELQSKTQLNNVRILEEARPTSSPSSPNVLMNMVLGLLAGVTLGIGLAALREWMDDTISSPLDITTYLRAPILGMIPKIGDVNEEADRTLFTHLNPKSNIAEAVRGMRTLIDLNPSGISPKRLLVTSAMSSEGKTSTAMRLAIAFANLNRRVLIIDADLRRPRIHKVFDGDREPGFATILQGQSPPKDAVRPTPVPNLWYMASGKGTDRPNEILASTSTTHVLDALDEMFDLIIIDTPPSVVLSDARILSRHVDGVVMIVKEKATSRMLIRDAMRGLEAVGANLLGVVLNEVDFSRRKSANYYGYGYGYGYRYDRYYYDSDDDQTESVAK